MISARSDLQNFSIGSGLKFASIHGHRQHAVIADGAGQLDKTFIAEIFSASILRSSRRSGAGAAAAA